MNTRNSTFIFDFDKTLVSVEGLDTLAEISLMRHPHRGKLLAEICQITELGMRGVISFEESLSKRFFLMHPTDRDIQETCNILKRSITPSIIRNKSFFQKHENRIFVVSGGFRELILPVTDMLGINADHVYANSLTRNNQGEISGYDVTNPLSRKGGKSTVVRGLGGQNHIFIGDGYTDAEVKISGAATYFVAFTEHVARKNVITAADAMVRDFGEFANSVEMDNN